MDLQVRGRPDLAACFLNAYLEQSGDYEGLSLLRWYVVYRALVRAKVSLIREEQTALDSAQSRSLKTAAMGFVQIALEATRPATPQLWITHGVSGSGKTTGSLQFVRSENAIRLRSDVERKRLFGTAPADLKSPGYGQGMYSASASETVYRVLRCKAQSILQSGFSVVIDAAFLRQTDRQQFQELAKQERVAFHILAFDADEATLRKRVVDRGLAHNDASDADLAVLERQLRDREPLTAEELEWCAPQSGCATGKNNEA
jgi:predicted kinase